MAKHGRLSFLRPSSQRSVEGSLIPTCITLLILASAIGSVDAYGSSAGKEERRSFPPDPVLPPGVTTDMVPLPYRGNTVAGMVVTFDASKVTEYDGEDKDVIKVDIAGQGPTMFSMPRWNQGDFAPRIQPRKPYSQPNLAKLMPGTTGSALEDPSDIPAQAWRPSIQQGVMLGSIAQNGRTWNDSAPKFYGTVACTIKSHGFGYSMDDGQFDNRQPNINIAVGKLGTFLEANIDTAVAWFPYAQGWTAGYVDAPGEYAAEKAKNQWSSLWSFSPNLPEDASRAVKWDEQGCLLKLPGVDPGTSGMIFLTSTNPGPGNNDGNAVSAFVDSGGWRVQVREDDQPNPVLFCEPDQAMFAFIFVPWYAGGLIGAHVDGATGTVVNGRGTVTVTKVTEGAYNIEILRVPGLSFFQKQQPLTNRDGMLLLQVVGKDPNAPKFSQHAVLSYEILWNGTVRVEAHRLVRRSGPGPAGALESFPLVDASFYFAWVDFRAPLTPLPQEFTGRGFGGASSASSSGDSSGGSSEGPGFWGGLMIGWTLMSLVSMTLLGLSYLGARMGDRSSVLALAPLPEFGGAGGNPGERDPSQRWRQLSFNQVLPPWASFQNLPSYKTSWSSAGLASSDSEPTSSAPATSAPASSGIVSEVAGLDSKPLLADSQQGS